ncbi:CheR family methyltransferase [Papillibacter cinnamivorans]|uniref:protein-glutamate O-methyltransferase n=1 Tax=Papillibacter cinnamivorans DSM 12816 TaxID=1122930 RepID=A0A1W1YIA4_9FIRM|nr:protein-glutamate O-methyltransferase CheR [Papillibacter cinnamivorans]SMC35852.1 chemotaxis protein methyltransferase CheR [Papillibacter cinnamivorans DSM 12816]
MTDITEKEYEHLTGYIFSNFGIKLGAGKKTLVLGRLQSILQQYGFGTFSEYYAYVTSDKTGRAVSELVDRITTNHTFFMREPDHFFYFRDYVLPQLARSVPEKDLRIWSAGCSSGEEAYTLAMIIQDFFGSEKPMWDAKILATDISSKVLDAAKKGEYKTKSLEALPAAWKSNFVKKDQEKSEITDKLKNEVIFRYFNLMNEYFPFRKKFHVIFCRNVMIYFDMATKTALVNRFYDSLEAGGYLFIGHSESIGREETQFQYVMPAIYRKGL